MPEYRVKFPDDEVWKIKITGKSGEEALKMAHTRAAVARAAEGKSVVPFEECDVQKVTSKLRAELTGVTYLGPAELLDACCQIGEEYRSRGLDLTVRGMYYQLVSRGLLPSGLPEYNRVKSSLAKARLQGDFPLGLLSDSSRTLHPGDITRYDLDVDEAVDQANEWIPKLDRFFLQASRWYRQPDLPIVLFEKEALSNAFGPVCYQLEVPWMAVKGYSSVSTLHALHRLMEGSVDPEIRDKGSLADLDMEWLQSLDPGKKGDLEELLHGHKRAVENLEWSISRYWSEQTNEDGSQQHVFGARRHYQYGELSATEWHQGFCQNIRLLYFGDHDPDGMEIPLDLERRLKIIQVRENQIIPFSVERIGLNQDQIEKYNPPPFWAKPTSARHSTYLENHPWAENRAWELDALDPIVLRDLARDAVDGYFRSDVFEEVQSVVEEMREEFNKRMSQEA
jgi:hypothetical protein